MQIAIIGGGAAGMTAAIAAAREGATVTIFEKMDRVGKKILTTGNGRCNISNEDMDLSHFHGGTRSFIQSVLEKVSPEDTREFWESLGLVLITLEEGKMYPMSLQASGVLDALRMELERLNVTVKCAVPVEKIIQVKRSWRLVSAGGIDLGRFQKVIITVGGKASPQLGADGAGVQLASQLKHTVVPLRPGLVKLRCRSPYLKALAGCKVEAKASLMHGDEVLQEEWGEVLFTAEGLSGPPILRLAREAMVPGRNCSIALNLMENMREGECFWWLKQRSERFAHMTVQEMLSGIMNKRLILPMLKENDISAQMKSGQLNKHQIQAVARMIHGWSFPVIGDAGWKEAQVTVGGVFTGEIDAATLESKKNKGIYWAGEVLDVDGDCGGYNLQWAASSGILAGKSAAYVAAEVEKV
ncbi:MAG: aminoacetone oxidase family FAD-binding enzyme [Firmicutes bacterium]|nr:aminoacetone oxidase family FAD-binding enzyme [Bacillota bacterium]